MHTLIALSTILPVLVAGYLALRMLRTTQEWSRRRDLQLLILAAPVAGLALGISNLPHYVSNLCFVNTPAWDYTLGIAIPLVMSVVALGGMCLGLIRFLLMSWVIARKHIPAPLEMQTFSDTLATRLGAPRPRVLVFVHDRPMAFTMGLYKATILLSTWMVQHFDRQELEAVVAHEMAHIARRDYLVAWLALVLRDAFWYLPASQVAYAQLQREKELACDDLAAMSTQRPMALASALAKTWQHAVGGPHFGLAQPLLDGSELIETRIERLLQATRPPESTLRLRLMALGLCLVVLAALVIAETANVAALFTPLNCGPV
jgi:bla regulator protein BlaR1